MVAALVAASFALLIYQHNTGWMYDAKVYRAGGAAVLHGEDLYRRLPPPAFTYPPFAALLFVPFAFLSVNTLGLLWTALSIFCLELTVWNCLARLGVAGRRLRLGLAATTCALAVWLDPVSLTLLLGQVNLVLMCLVILDILAPESSRWKGLGVGAAAGIKLLPAFFIIYLVVTRRVRAAAVAVAGFAATVVIGLAIIPGDALRYWGGVVWDSSRVGDPQNVRSQSLRSVFVRLAHTTQGVEVVWIIAAIAVVVGALAVTVLAHRRGEELLAVCVCATATLLISPITWQHHWVWMVPILLWLFHRAWRSRSRLVGVLAAVLALEFFVRPYQWGIPIDRVADLHLTPAQLAASSSYAVSAVAFLAIAAWLMLPRTSHQTSTSPERTGALPNRALR